MKKIPPPGTLKVLFKNQAPCLNKRVSEHSHIPKLCLKIDLLIVLINKYIYLYYLLIFILSSHNFNHLQIGCIFPMKWYDCLTITMKLPTPLLYLCQLKPNSHYVHITRLIEQIFLFFRSDCICMSWRFTFRITSDFYLVWMHLSSKTTHMRTSVHLFSHHLGWNIKNFFDPSFISNIECNLNRNLLGVLLWMAVS